MLNGQPEGLRVAGNATARANLHDAISEAHGAPASATDLAEVCITLLGMARLSAVAFIGCGANGRATLRSRRSDRHGDARSSTRRSHVGRSSCCGAAGPPLVR